MARVCAGALDCHRRDGVRLSWAGYCREGSDGGPRSEHVQLFLSHGGAAAPLASAVVYARCKQFGARDGGRDDPVPLLWRDFWDRHDVVNRRGSGPLLRTRVVARDVSAPGGNVFGFVWAFCSIGRQQGDHWGALRTAGGQGFAGSSGMGGTGLQCRGSVAKSDQSVLDASTDRYSEN